MKGSESVNENTCAYFCSIFKKKMISKLEKILQTHVKEEVHEKNIYVLPMRFLIGKS